MVQVGERCAAMGVLAAVALLMFAYKTGKERGMSDSLNFLCEDGNRCAGGPGTRRRRLKLLVFLGDSNLFFEESTADSIADRQRETLAGMLAERAAEQEWSSIYVPLYHMAGAVHRNSIKWTLMSWLGWLVRHAGAKIVFVLALGQNDCLSLPASAPVDPLSAPRWQNSDQKRLWSLAQQFGQMFDGNVAYRPKFFDNPRFRAPQNYAHAQSVVAAEFREHRIQELDVPDLCPGDFADQLRLTRDGREKVAEHVWQQLTAPLACDWALPECRSWQ